MIQRRVQKEEEIMSLNYKPQLLKNYYKTETRTESKTEKQSAYLGHARLRVQSLVIKKGKGTLMRKPYNPGVFSSVPPLPHPISSPSEPLLSWSHHPITGSLLSSTAVQSRGANLDVFISSLPKNILLLQILISFSQCNRMHNCYGSTSPSSTEKVQWLLECARLLKCFASADERCFTSSKHSCHYLSSTQNNRGNLATIFFPWLKKRLITLMAMRVN